MGEPGAATHGDRGPRHGSVHRAPGPLSRAWQTADAHAGLVLLGGAALAALTFLINLSSAPDFNFDETVYALAGQHIGGGNAVTFEYSPILVHPPLFFLAVAGWLGLTGHLHSGVVTTIHAGRYLNAAFDIGLVVCIGGLARQWTVGRPSAARGRVVVLAVVLAALNPFLIRFGRTLILEPMAVLAGIGTIAVAWRLRHASTALYVAAVGGMIGVTILIKEPALFIVLAPLVAAILQRAGRQVVRDVAALAVGAVLWSAFPLWAASIGQWHNFQDTQTLSIRRLFGVVQVTGLNRPGVNRSASALDTLWQYLGGYVLFLLGAVVLLVAAWRWARARLRLADEALASVVALGVTTYAFLGYSFVAGQSNEQLTVYAVPAAVLLATVGLDRLVQTSSRDTAVRAGTAVAAVATVLGLASWLQYSIIASDDATARVERYIRAHYAACIPINSTGDTTHWAYTLRTNPITEYTTGPEALQQGVHLFLLSPKDADLRYGPSSPELEAWIKSHGREVFAASSTTSDSISLWEVGTPVVPAGSTLPGCVDPLPKPDEPASALKFGAIGGGLLLADLVVIAVAARLQRRRSDTAPVGAGTSSTSDAAGSPDR
ncbi:MAG: ArnT family glycosyltransferase [Jatrophihabitans sp.]|uniref:ArnT family glycosyltransferase n=1 Tax=Jatrophihabitans sp. TaxID=1932789 RepID=UPI003F7D4084